ncbi:MAG: hypothetical protein C7B45_12660 [Sulfobacillus acidophilus]|uniref:Uncharacterized protein n=1 Tax=Sulfobacillus acidophilus TaxID=53633 RepID=A0A2T2WFI7_9FIRM|nr:MAG: hypothetical protein C7B45_12660 [Sulfobacillus acidophilus]
MASGEGNRHLWATVAPVGDSGPAQYLAHLPPVRIDRHTQSVDQAVRVLLLSIALKRKRGHTTSFSA